MDQNSKLGGKVDSVTPSTASLNQRLATSSGPRMLTESEIALLKKSKAEIAAQLFRARQAAK